MAPSDPPSSTQTNTAHHKKKNKTTHTQPLHQWTLKSIFSVSLLITHTPCSASLLCSFSSSTLLPVGFTCLRLLIWLNDDMRHSILINRNDPPAARARRREKNWYRQMTIGSFSPICISSVLLSVAVPTTGEYVRAAGGGRIVNILSPDCQQHIPRSRGAIHPHAGWKELSYVSEWSGE